MMKKRIICLMMAVLLILTCSCKSAVQDEQTATATDIKTEELHRSEISEKEELTQSVTENKTDEKDPSDKQNTEKENIVPEDDEREPENELYNYEVTEEPFEAMNVNFSLANYRSYDSEQELFDRANMVIIGMPIETFTEGEEHYYTATGYRIEKNDNGIVSYCTVRNVKVLEVLKGDNTLESVRVAEHAVVKDEEDGSKSIMGLPSGCKIAKKNVKYLYYLVKSDSDKYDYYFAAMDNGMINIDGLDTRFSNGTSRYEAAKNRVPKLFEKYDRSAELVKEKEE